MWFENFRNHFASGFLHMWFRVITKSRQGNMRTGCPQKNLNSYGGVRLEQYSQVENNLLFILWIACGSSRTIKMTRSEWPLFSLALILKIILKQTRVFILSIKKSSNFHRISRWNDPKDVIFFSLPYICCHVLRFNKIRYSDKYLYWRKEREKQQVERTEGEIDIRIYI
jgi:hypothetical protein